jgi:hypothetical protein
MPSNRADDRVAEPINPPPAPAAPREDRPHYYHAWLPHVSFRKGRPDQVLFRNGIFQPQSEEDEERVRAYLAPYVPGRNPDRWKGDNLFHRAPDGTITPKFRECPECGMQYANDEVYDDHIQHTKHGIEPKLKRKARI